MAQRQKKPCSQTQDLFVLFSEQNSAIKGDCLKTRIKHGLSAVMKECALKRIFKMQRASHYTMKRVYAQTIEGCVLKFTQGY